MPTPVIIRYFKSKPAPIRLPEDAEEPLTSPTSTSFPAEAHNRTPSPPSRPEHHHHDANFDLNVAKVSVGIEVFVYILMVFSSSGPMFAVIATLGAFGMGFGPAIQSVALTLYNRRGGKDSGRLFGAMSVVQSLRCVQSPPPSLAVFTCIGATSDMTWCRDITALECWALSCTA